MGRKKIEITPITGLCFPGLYFADMFSILWTSTFLKSLKSSGKPTKNTKARVVKSFDNPNPKKSSWVGDRSIINKLF